MELLDPVTVGCFVLGAVFGALLGMVSLCNAPRSAEQDVAAARANFRAGWISGYRSGLAENLTRPGDEA